MNNRHIAIVTSYPFPGEPVIRNRITAYVNVLSDSGWKVTVIATASRTIGVQGTAVHIPNCEIVYVPIGDYDRANFVVRGLNELRLSWQLLRKSAEIHPDVVLVTVPSIFLLLFALKRFARIHVVDVRDLVWEYLPKHPWWKGAARRFLRTGAIMALRRANMIGFSNPYELEYVQQQLPSKRLLLASNGIGREQFDLIGKLRHQPGPEGVLRITYVGNVGIAQNLTTLVQAVAGLKQFQVNIIGSGTDFNRVRMAIHQHGAQNVCLHGSMPWEEAIAWYSRSDVLYAQLSSAFATAMPSKLYEYLSTGLPVIYGGTGVAIEILKSFSGATVVEPNSPEQLRNALFKMQEHGVLENYTDNIERIYRQYIREDQLIAIERVISENTINAKSSQ